MPDRRVAVVASSVGFFSGALLVALTSGAGCTHDRPPEEAKIDAQLPDTNLEVSVSIPPLSVLVGGGDRPADISCNGSPRPDAGPIFADAGSADADDEAGVDAAVDSAAPDGGWPLGTLVEKEIELIAFGSGGTDKLPKQAVDVYYGNSFTKAPDVVGVMSDDKGILRVKVPFGLRVGYHARASELLSDFWSLDDMHYALEGVALPRWQGITKERQDTLALAITGEKGYVMKPKTGIVSARVVDCERRYVQFASITLRDYTDDPAGKELPFGKCGEGLCIVFLGDTELPDPARTYTSRSALFAMVDVPSDRKLALVATGLAADGSRVQFARRVLEVREGQIASHYLEPTSETKF